jgi:hypothetical protein
LQDFLGDPDDELQRIMKSPKFLGMKSSSKAPIRRMLWYSIQRPGIAVIRCSDGSKTEIEGRDRR